MCTQHAPTTFFIKNKKINMKISKHSHDLGNYPKTGVKIQKYPQIKTLFCLFQSQKHALIVHY
jgi:hypothetical protein